MASETLYMLLIQISTGGAAALLAFVAADRYFRTVDWDDSHGSSPGKLAALLAPLRDFLSLKARAAGSMRQQAADYDRMITEAGGFAGLDGYGVMAAKAALPILLFIFAMFSGAMAGIDLGITALCAIFFMICSYLYPDSLLKAKAARRKALFMKQLPDGLDILKVAADSGLDFYSSVSYLVDIYIPGPVREEMRIFTRELKLGVPMATALTNIAGRVNVPEASMVFVSLAQALEMGTSIVEMLDSATRDMRGKRLLDAESEAQKAVVKMTFPLLLLILPGIFIVLLAPVLRPMLQVFQSFGQ